MDKTTKEFIKACKAKQPTESCLKVLEEHYLTDGMADKHKYHTLCLILSDIVDEYCHVIISEFLSRKDQTKSYLAFGHSVDKNICEKELAFETLLSIIRFTEKSKFKGIEESTDETL